MSAPASSETEKPEHLSETAADLSEKIFSEYRNWVQSVAESLREDKQPRAAEQHILSEIKANEDLEPSSQFDLAAELGKTREQTRESEVEIARLKEILAAKDEEIEELHSGLAKDHEELQEAREKLLAERRILDEDRSRLEIEKSSLEKALQEVAGELQELSFQREELNNSRKELQDALLAFRSAREGFHAELSMSPWSGKTN